MIHYTIPHECEKCAYKSNCAGGVYDRRYLWHGSLEKKDPYCPGTFLEKTPSTITFSNRDFVSVHDGYLPTMFFRP